MTEKERKFINEFQENLVIPVHDNLVNRKHRNWENNLLCVVVEEVICSLSILPKQNGEFDLAYFCMGDITQASYRLNDSITHIEHSLWEVLMYLELYNLKGGLLPLGQELQHLMQGITKLLQIVNPRRYGNFK